MEMITVTAKTLDEAITKALIELGTTSDNLDYEVIEKGSAGIFGLFSKNVVIRAKKKSEENLDDLFASIKDEVKEKTEKPEKKEAPKKEFKKESRKERSEQKSEQKPKSENRQKNDKSERNDKPRFEGKSKSEQRPKQEPKPRAEKVETEPVKKPVETAVEPKEEKKAEKRNIDAAACEKAAKEFLNQVFGAMGMEVTLETSYDEEERELTVDMAGDDMGILIGKRGQTLDSLQYLVSLVVNKECDGYLRVKLDTENYRSRRKETLETLAKNIAYKVKRTRRSVSLEPMNPYERRIIHAALQNDKYVVTRSEGEDPFRHVVISLKREGRENRENRGNRNNQQ